MIKDAIGVIDASEEGIQLKEITRNRSVAAVPIGSRYRMVDFVLSNMVNSGISNVGIVTLNHYNSLMAHLGTGKEWDLNRKHGGLFIFPPYSGNGTDGWYRGNVEAIHSIMDFIRRSEQQYVIASGSHMICNMSYDEAFQFHLDKGADITILYTEQKGLPMEEVRQKTLIEVDEDGRVTDMQVKPTRPKFKNTYMNMYIIDKELLDYLLDECISHGNSDFVKDILLRKLNTLRVYGYKFEGYLASIDSINAYYRHNMELLDPGIREQLFFKSGLVHTRIMDEVPAIYSDFASVKNCMVGDGCIIDGEIENSILFRGVKVAKGAHIKNSIIMQNSEIYDNAVLENVILDKEVIIRKGKKLIGQTVYPVVVAKKAVI